MFKKLFFICLFSVLFVPDVYAKYTYVRPADDADPFSILQAMNGSASNDLSTANFGPAVSGNITLSDCRIYAFSAYNDSPADTFLQLYNADDVNYPNKLLRMYLIPAEDQIVLSREDFGPLGTLSVGGLTWAISTTANAFTSGDPQDYKIMCIYAQ